MRIALCFSDVHHLPEVKEMGYDAYEVPGWKLGSYSEEEFAEHVKIHEEAGLPLIGVNVYSSGEPAAVGPLFDPKKVRAYGELVGARAARLGSPALGIGMGKARNVPEGYDRAKAYEEFLCFTRITADIAASYGMRTLVEGLSRYQCNFIHTTEEAAEAARACERDNMGLVLDFYHVKMNEENAREAYLKHKEMVFHVHVSSAEGQIKRGYPTMEDQAEYEEIAAALREGGYQGVVSLEPDFYDAEAAKESLRMLRKAFG